MKLSRFIPKKAVTIFLVFFSLTGVIFTAIEGIGPERRKYCGTIKEKIIVPGGYKKQGEMYFGMQFDTKGFEAIKVDVTTYMKHVPGQRVCFWLLPESSAWQVFSTLGKLFSFSFLLCYVVWCLFFEED